MTISPSPLIALRDALKSRRFTDALAVALNTETTDPEFSIARAGVLLQSPDYRQKGGELFDAAKDIPPENADWASDLGLSLILTGDLKGALAVLQDAVTRPGADAVAFSRLGAALFSLHDFDKAGDAYEEAILRQPGRAEWLHNMASVRLNQQRLEESLELYDQALLADPGQENSKELRFQVLAALDRPAEIAEELEVQLQNDPEDLHLRLKLARALEMDQRDTEALRALQDGLPIARAKEEVAEEAETLESDEPAVPTLKRVDILLEGAAIHARRDRHGMALRILNRAEQLDPERLEILVRKGTAQKEMRLFDKAQETVDKAKELFPEALYPQLLSSSLLEEQGDYERAEEILRSLLETYPGSAEVFGALGHNLMWRGKIDEAVEMFERASQINPASLASLVEARDLAHDDETVEKMRSLADSQLTLPQPRMALSFALAKALDKRKDFDLAFHYLHQGNELTRKTVSYTPQMATNAVDALIQHIEPALFERLKGVGHPSARPVFVCGMPRSGTTLTEQILGSHPDIFPAGELPLLPQIARRLPAIYKLDTQDLGETLKALDGPGLNRVAKFYLNNLKTIDSQAPFVVDKMPHNFMHLWLIALIFPNAKIIHMRRDPRDVGLSNYQQNFKAKHGMLGYSVDLEHTGLHLNDHQRLMDHWHKVLPMPIFELDYEQLVEDQEGMTQRILEFVGVDWDSHVTDFHKTERAVRTASVWQVRQPIYKTSRQKWRRYETHLKPMLDVLDPALTAPYDD
ncbi:MAG: sulfotransferase [Magnetospiraceae bacterium]